MRDYLYIWHDPKEQFLFASGIEFRDVVRVLPSVGGIVLLRHKVDDPEYDSASKFSYLPTSRIADLLAEDLYTWGDFFWADYAPAEFPTLPRHEVAELLYFGHAAEKLGEVCLSSLGNRYLTCIHDDGWYFKTYYSEWKHAVTLLTSLPQLRSCPEVIESLREGSRAFWISGGVVDSEARTLDIDAVLNRRLP